MCHTDIPPGRTTPDCTRAEVRVPLPSGEAMPALLASAGDGAPCVLIACDVFGRSPFYEHLAALLAEAGFQALVPDFFFRQGPLAARGKEAALDRRRRLDEAGALEDLRAALAWLRARLSGSAVGAVGFCMGGTFVLDLASSEDELVSVAYYGFPVPQASLSSPPPAPMSLVEWLRGPVLAFWGEEDEAVGMDHVARYVERAAAVNPAFRGHVLPGLGHGFLGSADLGDPADLGAATWSQALVHLGTHLQAKPAAGAVAHVNRSTR